MEELITAQGPAGPLTPHTLSHLPVVQGRVYSGEESVREGECESVGRDGAVGAGILCMVDVALLLCCRFLGSAESRILVCSAVT